MTLEDFGDIAKQKLMYDYYDNDAVSGMLEWSETNSRLNEDMSKWVMSTVAVVERMEGKYVNLLYGWDMRLQKLYLNMDGYARQQAIEMRGAETRAEEERQKEEKRGFLALVGLK